MPRTCSSTWKHSDGHAATVASLAEALAPHLQRLTDANSAIYSSRNMQRGIDIEMLRDNIALLVGLVELDPRGGAFAQNGMCPALAKALQEHDKLEIMHATETACMMMPEETVLFTSFLVRVMFSHVRQAYDNCANHDLHLLARAYTMINVPSSVGFSRSLMQGDRA